MGMYCFGIDVGGTSVKCGLFLTNGTLVEQWEIPTRLENNGSSILPDVADAIKTKLDERGITKDNVDGVGIGIPGPVKKVFPQSAHSDFYSSLFLAIFA